MCKKLLVIPLLLLAYGLAAQTTWQLKAEQNGIKVYTRNMPGERVKAIKIECVLEATLPQLAYVIMDINTGDQWVYNTKYSKLLKQVSPLDIYYYSEVSVPWPVLNRDFAAHLVVRQDPNTRVLTVDAENMPGMVPQKPNVVRIMQSTAKWVAMPAGVHSVKIEYTLFADPGGNIPAWLINMFITKGPMESFLKLREHLSLPAYAHARLAGIRE